MLRVRLKVDVGVFAGVKCTAYKHTPQYYKHKIPPISYHIRVAAAYVVLPCCSVPSFLHTPPHTHHTHLTPTHPHPSLSSHVLLNISLQYSSSTHLHHPPMFCSNHQPTIPLLSTLPPSLPPSLSPTHLRPYFLLYITTLQLHIPSIHPSCG